MSWSDRLGRWRGTVCKSAYSDAAQLNVRTFDADVRKRVLAAIERIVNAEAAASAAPRAPEITPLDRYPLNVNDQQASARVVDAFRRYFPEDRVQQTGPAPASEDFGSFGTEWHVPSVFWFVGAKDPDIYAKAKEEGRRRLGANLSPMPIVTQLHERARLRSSVCFLSSS
jgi:metal-dependent amidase/aminoacylase/carboxypeptidase family protein